MESEPNISKYRAAKWGGWGFILLGPGTVLVLWEYMPFSGLLYTEVVFTALLFMLPYGAYRVIGLMRAWEWEAVGRPAGLTPIDGKPRREELSKKMDSKSTPILTGRVGGRVVRALSFSESKGAKSGSRMVTIIETDLRHPSDGGVIVEPAEDGFLLDTISSAPGEDEVYQDAPDVPGRRFAAVGDPSELAKTVLSGRSRDAVSAIQPFHRLLVGNEERALRNALPDWEDKAPDSLESSLGFAIDSGMKMASQGPQFRGDTQTVTHYLADETIRDPDVLEQHAKSVVAVAEAFDTATSSRDAGCSGEQKERT